MKWSEKYGRDQMPSMVDIKDFLGEGEALLTELSSHIGESYHTEPRFSYSRCAAQPGWNLKYQKGGKSLCTLYPMAGYLIALVVVGQKEEGEVEEALQAGLFTPYVGELIRKIPVSAGGRWLMIEMRDRSVLADVKLLLNTRVKIKDKAGH